MNRIAGAMRDSPNNLGRPGGPGSLAAVVPFVVVDYAKTWPPGHHVKER